MLTLFVCRHLSLSSLINNDIFVYQVKPSNFQIGYNTMITINGMVSNDTRQRNVIIYFIQFRYLSWQMK